MLVCGGERQRPDILPRSHESRCGCPPKVAQVIVIDKPVSGAVVDRPGEPAAADSVSAFSRRLQWRALKLVNHVAASQQRQPR